MIQGKLGFVIHGLDPCEADKRERLMISELWSSVICVHISLLLTPTGAQLGFERGGAETSTKTQLEPRLLINLPRLLIKGV